MANPEPGEIEVGDAHEELGETAGEPSHKKPRVFFRFVSGFGILWKKSLMKFQNGELDRIGVLSSCNGYSFAACGGVM